MGGLKPRCFFPRLISQGQDTVFLILSGIEVLLFIEVCKASRATAPPLRIPLFFLCLSISVSVRLHLSLTQSGLAEAFLQYVPSPSQ